MDWITESVAIGNYREAEDAELLRTESIRSVLSLIPSSPHSPLVSLGLERREVVPLLDGGGNDLRVFQRAVDLLIELAWEAPPVLVHCHAGRSRSPVVLAAYLMRVSGITAEEAMERIASKRDIAVTPEVLELLDRLD